jgi:PIN domain nuclease of toxin-antitoxin system
MILLDTCALLWLVMEPTRLSSRAKTLISTHHAELAVSAISAFEIALKAGKKKLALPLPPNDWWPVALSHHGIVSIAVSDEIALASAALPPHHNDPADRMIIATAQLHRAPVITSDALFQHYPSISVEW